MWITKFQFPKVREYEITRTKLLNVRGPEFTVVFGDRGEIELHHRSFADASTTATREAIHSLGMLLLELGLVCEPTSLHTFNAASSEPIPKLLGLAEVAQMLGISRSRASQLAKSGELPSPVARPKMGPIFVADAIVATMAMSRCPRCATTNLTSGCSVCDPAVADAGSPGIAEDASLANDQRSHRDQELATEPPGAGPRAVARSKPDRLGLRASAA